MRILVIAPHPDDEVLGCGGMIAKRASEGHQIYVHIVTKARPPLYSNRYAEAEAVETQKAADALGVMEWTQGDFASAMLDTYPQYQVCERLSLEIDRIEPDEAYIPHWGDAHRDHRIVSEAAMVAVRPKGRHMKVYAYEVLSETGWSVPAQHNEFIPNRYLDIGEHINTKVLAMTQYGSQATPLRSPEAIETLARCRGAAVGLQYAEAYEVVREVAE